MNPFIVMFVVLLLIAGAVVFSRSDFFLVQEYVVEGNHYYTEQEILLMGDCKTGQNLLWETDCSRMKERLDQDTYIETVEVRRSLPDTVTITVSERRQLAAIVYGEQFVIIDEEGMVLRKVSSAPKLTILQGLTISKLSMGETIEVEETLLLRQALEMLTAMEKHDMYFARLEVSKQAFRAYILDHLFCEGSPENITAAIEKGKVQKVTAELFEKKIERGIIQISGDRYVSFSPKID